MTKEEFYKALGEQAEFQVLHYHYGMHDSECGSHLVRDSQPSSTKWEDISRVEVLTMVELNKVSFDRIRVRSRNQFVVDAFTKLEQELGLIVKNAASNEDVRKEIYDILVPMAKKYKPE